MLIDFLKKSVRCNISRTFACYTVDAKEVANKERLFPKEWINNQGNNVTAFALDYFLPLIQGEVNVLMENGMPVHLKIPNWF